MMFITNRILSVCYCICFSKKSVKRCILFKKNTKFSAESINFAQPILIPKASRGADGQTYIHIRRNWRFGFDAVRISQIHYRLSKTKQRERLMGCIVYSSHWLWTTTACPSQMRKWFIYLHHTWGFRRCSFRQSGQCESLYCVERVTGLAPRFLICM